MEVHCPPEAKAVAGWLCVEGEGGEGRLGKKVSTKDGAGQAGLNTSSLNDAAPAFYGKSMKTVLAWVCDVNSPFDARPHYMSHDS